MGSSITEAKKNERSSGKTLLPKSIQGIHISWQNFGMEVHFSWKQLELILLVEAVIRCRWVFVFNLPHRTHLPLMSIWAHEFLLMRNGPATNESRIGSGSKTISSSLYSDGTLRNDKIVMIISHWLQSIPKGSIMNFSRFSEDYIYYWCLNDWFSDNICHQINILSVPKSAKKKELKSCCNEFLTQIQVCVNLEQCGTTKGAAKHDPTPTTTPQAAS